MAENDQHHHHHHDHRYASRAAQEAGRRQASRPLASASRPLAAARRRTTPSKTHGPPRPHAGRATRRARPPRPTSAPPASRRSRASRIAERAALSYVGATLEARDRVIETAGIGGRHVRHRARRPSASSRSSRRATSVAAPPRATSSSATSRRPAPAWSASSAATAPPSSATRPASRNVVTEQLAGVSNRVEEASRSASPPRSASARSPRTASPRSRSAPDLPPRADRRGGAAGKPAGLISRRWDSPASYLPAGAAPSPPSTVAVPLGRGVGL